MKKIMFNDEYGLTAAVIAETKKQTRRIIPNKAFDAWNDIDDGDEYSRSVYAASYEAKMRNFLLEYAQYKVGEEVAVAMAYKGFYGDFKEPLRTELVDSAGFFNKMFVKAKLMPHQIEITGIRVERLQDISDADCLSEGILKEHVRLEYDEPQDTVLYSFQNSNKLKPMPKTSLAGYYDSAKTAYAALIDAISGKGTWDNNPYVFVYNFKLLKKEEK